MPTLPLNTIADVVYSLPGVGAPRLGFDLGLVIDTSDVISLVDRVTVYDSLAAMITAGFSNMSDAYLAATAYFAANSQPTQIAIGRQGSGETCLQALQACRVANSDWYIAYIPAALDADHIAIAAYIEALNTPYSQYFVQSGDAAVRNDTPGNLFETLKNADYDRTLQLYSTSDFAAAAVMGYAMGATTDFANSGYTLFGKQLPTITTESLTTAQVNNIEGNNGNVYVNRGSFYNIFEKGNQASGSWFDEIIYLDKLTNQIQLNVADLLYTSPKIPQTEAGMAQIKSTVAAACQNLVNIGFIAPGPWTGSNVLTLKTGDYLPDGFIVLSDSIASQSQGDRDARIAPNVYVAIKLAGAIQSVFVQINVNR